MDIFMIISAFLGAVISFFLSIPIENQRKPKLTLSIDDFSFDDHLQDKPAKVIKVLRVKLTNRKVKKYFSFWLKREAAINTNATIQLLHYEDFAPLFTNPVHARWPRSDEPISPQFHPETKKLVLLFDLAKYNAVMTRNIYPGTEEPIDVIARYDDEEDCYIWNNDIYYKGWRNKEVKIPKGRYFVIISIYTSGEQTTGYFKLENSLSINDFRLQHISKEEEKRIKQSV